MTDRTIILSISIPPDMGEDLAGMSMSLESKGVPHELAATFILAAGEVMFRTQMQSELSDNNPLASGDVIVAAAALNARLAVVDAIMHLPMGGQPASAMIDMTGGDAE